MFDRMERQRMARPFSSKDAKRLICEHHRILGQLSSAPSFTESYRCEIKNASDALVTQEVFSVLKDTPVC